MVAVIKSGRPILSIFHYHENKVKKGVAQCIGAGNYPLDVEKMTGTMRLNRLLKRAALNENVKHNCIHISLNFDASDAGLTSEKLMEIAGTYMRKIGFGSQPYLVYQHFDAGHTHIHLVSVTIREDGSCINIHKIGRNKSEKARREIEKSFGLVVADGHKKQGAFRLGLVAARKVQYGKMETGRSIADVLDAVLEQYHYTCLSELNAVLRSYNVMADRGGENSRTFKNGGLVYRVLDEQGNPVGMPIKASNFESRPTLKLLEARFTGNKAKRLPHKARLKNAIDLAILGRKGLSVETLADALEKQGIQAVLHREKDDVLYGITYVDHRTKCVFNDNALGEQYSAKAIQERCSQKKAGGMNRLSHPVHGQDMGLWNHPDSGTENKTGLNDLPSESTIKREANTPDPLARPEEVFDDVPGQLKKKNKKKRKKILPVINKI